MIPGANQQTVISCLQEATMIIPDIDLEVKPVDETDGTDLAEIMVEMYGRDWWEVCHDGG